LCGYSWETNSRFVIEQKNVEAKISKKGVFCFFHVIEKHRKVNNSRGIRIAEFNPSSMTVG